MFVGAYTGQDNVVLLPALECVDTGYLDFLWSENVCVNTNHWSLIHEILMLQSQECKYH